MGVPLYARDGHHAAPLSFRAFAKRPLEERARREWYRDYWSDLRRVDTRRLPAISHAKHPGNYTSRARQSGLVGWNREVITPPFATLRPADGAFKYNLPTAGPRPTSRPVDLIWDSKTANEFPPPLRNKTRRK